MNIKEIAKKWYLLGAELVDQSQGDWNIEELSKEFDMEWEFHKDHKTDISKSVDNLKNSNFDGPYMIASEELKSCKKCNALIAPYQTECQFCKK